MKKVLLAATLFFLCSSLKAQELGFEETVKYIKDKVEKGEFQLGYKEADVCFGAKKLLLNKMEMSLLN